MKPKVLVNLVKGAVVLAVTGILGFVIAIGAFGFHGSCSRYTRRGPLDIVVSIRKAANVFALSGRVPTTSDNEFLTTLNGLAMTQVTEGDTTTWPGITFVRAEHTGSLGTWGVVIRCETDAGWCEKMWEEANDDPTMVGGTVGEIRCQGPETAHYPGGLEARPCFNFPGSEARN